VNTDLQLETYVWKKSLVNSRFVKTDIMIKEGNLFFTYMGKTKSVPIVDFKGIRLSIFDGKHVIEVFFGKKVHKFMCNTREDANTFKLLIESVYADLLEKDIIVQKDTTYIDMERLFNLPGQNNISVISGINSISSDSGKIVI